MTDLNSGKLKVNNEKFPPSDWVETTLGQVCEKVGDGLHGTPRYSEYGEYFFINGNNIVNGKIEIKQDTKKVDQAEFDKYKKDLNERTILLSINGTIGNLAKYRNEKCILGKSAAYLNIKNDASVDFIYYLMFENRFQYDISKNANGSTIKNVGLAQLRNYSFLLPPLLEQIAIASVLSSFDDKIELLREQNKTLEEMGQTLFNEKCIVKNEKLPEGWRIGKITEIIKREPVSYKCDKKDLDPKGKTPIIDQGSNGLYGYTSRNPDFIATKENPVILFTNHTCNYWFIDYPFCAIQNVLPYRGKDWYDEYILYFMTKGSITFIEYKGHWPDFEAKDFVIPPVEIAQKFSEIAKPILQKISDNNSQIQSLSKSRDELLPRLMRGEVRVSGEVKC